MKLCKKPFIKYNFISTFIKTIYHLNSYLVDIQWNKLEDSTQIFLWVIYLYKKKVIPHFHGPQIRYVWNNRTLQSFRILWLHLWKCLFIYIYCNSSVIFVTILRILFTKSWADTHTAKNIRSTLIRHWSKAKVSDRCLVNVNPMFSAIRDAAWHYTILKTHPAAFYSWYVWWNLNHAWRGSISVLYQTDAQ